MQNKVKPIVIAISLITGFAGLAMDYQEPTNLSRLLLMGFNLAYITALILMIQNGRFIETAHFQKVQFCVVMVIVGALFRLMHWPFGNGIACLGLVGIASVYTVWFLKKKRKSLLDFLKVLWVVTAFIYAALRLLHWIDPDFVYVPIVLFCAAFVLYTKQEFPKKSIQRL